MFKTDKKIRERLNNVILETNHMPFGLSSYNRNEKISDFVDRKDEILKFKDQIQLIWQKKISKAIRLDGPAGVGKSTLFNFVKEEIEKERSKKTEKIQFLSPDTDILSCYFESPGIISTFSDIWRFLLEGLEPGFEEELNKDIGLPEYIMLNLVFRLLDFHPEAISSIIWRDVRPPNDLRFLKFVHIIDPILNRATDAVRELQEFYSKHKRQIRNQLKVDLDGVSFEIKKGDTHRILNLFRVLDEDDGYLDTIKQGDKTLFKYPKNVIDFFNDLMRFYACAVKKRPLLLLGIDETSKLRDLSNEKYYINLGTMFVDLRESLNHVLFVFISTTEDWSNYDHVIKTNSDLESQINDFMHKIPLNQLEVNEMIEVFKNRMRRFWNRYPTEKDAGNPYYPFSEALFEYVYRHKKRDLRRSIIFLNKLWYFFRSPRGEIPSLKTQFEVMRFVRSVENDPLLPNSMSSFEWKTINKSFIPRFTTNSKRSSAIEKGLEYAFRSLQRDQLYEITRVENNPLIRTSKKERKPDVYLELRGNMGAEERRHIEFQVKAYKADSTVSLDDIESSLELFNENFTDFIYFIITGKGLHKNAEFSVKELESKYTNRIRRPRLTDTQINCLYFLALYEEISGHTIDNDDIEIAEEALTIILGQDIQQFLIEVKRLSFRQAIVDDSISPPPLPKKTPVTLEQFTTPKKPIKKVISSLQDPQKGTWLQDNPDLDKFKSEFLALCVYLKTREKGSSKFKFTTSTVKKNIIKKDASLDEKLFSDLITELESNNLIMKVKKSYVLTDSGEDLYWKVKENGYK